MRFNHWKTRFLVIWAGQAVSLLTSSVLQMVLIWHLTFTTSSGLVLSVATMAGFLPMAVFGSVAGTLVDRWNRKRVMVIADLSIAALAAVLAIVAIFVPLPLWLILVILFLRSIGTAFHTPALSAVTPLIVPEDMLTKMAGYSQAVRSISYIAGPAVAAILYPIWSMSAIVALDVVGAVLASLTVALVAIPAVKPPDSLRGNVFSELVTGYCMVKEHRGLYQLLWVGAAYMFVFSPVIALFPLMSVQHFGGTTFEASIAEVAFAVGMLGGGLILGAWGGFKNRAYSIIGSIIVMAVSLGVSGLLNRDGFVVFAVACLFMGLSVPFYDAVLMSLYQQRIAPEYLGRAFGLSESLAALAMPLGLIVSGLLSDLIGVSHWFLIAGLGLMAIALVCLALPAIRCIEAGADDRNIG